MCKETCNLGDEYICNKQMFRKKGTRAVRNVFSEHKIIRDMLSGTNIL